MLTALNIAIHAGIAIAGLVLLLLLPLSARFGILMNYLAILPIILLPIIALHRLGGAMLQRLAFTHFTAPTSRRALPYHLGILMRIITWFVVAYAVSISVIPQQFSAEQFKVVRWMIWIPPVAFTILAFAPNRSIRPAAPIFYLVLLAYTALQIFGISRSETDGDALVLEAPGTGSWFVVHGGNSPLTNHHYHAGSQRYAIDLVHPDDILLDENNSELSDFTSFGIPALAPINGKVVIAEDRHADEAIGETNAEHIAGNHIVIEHKPGIYCLLAHLQSGSVLVEAGQSVVAGEPIAACGNSGNTSQPHHHIQLMTKPNLEDPQSKGIPFVMTTQRGLVQPRRHDQLGTGTDAD